MYVCVVNINIIIVKMNNKKKCENLSSISNWEDRVL